METINPNGPRVEKTKGPISVSRVYVSGEFQKKDTLTAEFKQQVTTKSFYPAIKVNSNMSANLFDAKDDFGAAEKEFESTEERVAWMLVPVNTTIEQVVAKLAAAPGATLYRVLSYEPILDDNQKYAIGAGLKTLDDFANKQALRYPDNHPTDARKLILNNGKVQYRRIFFMDKAQADIDARDISKTYITPEIQAELAPEGAAVLQGQRI